VKNRACAVCDGTDKKLLFRQEFSPIEGASLFAGYDVVVCGRCGFAYADDIPEQAVFDAYYRDLSKYEYDQRDGEESLFDRRRFEQNVGEVRDLLPKDAHVLEIGCSTGRLLHLLREAGFANVRGLDPSPGCAAGAKRLYGIEVATGTLAGSGFLGRNFDVVIGTALLEHVRDLGAALRSIAALLRPGGVFFCEVPDCTGFARFRDSPFQQFSIEHIDFFSAPSLANLHTQRGFVPVKTWQAVREHSQGYMMPVACGVFRVQPADAPRVAIVPDRVSEPALVQYIAQSRAVEKRLLTTIERLVADRTPILVWGVGTHTQRLLATSRLGEADIRAFVDSNTKYQDRQLDGRPIIGPEAVAGRGEPILVSSLTFQSEIAEQIRGRLGYPNELILLYES
jgi:SAM-dependent methyltransferase